MLGDSPSSVDDQGEVEGVSFDRCPAKILRHPQFFIAFSCMPLVSSQVQIPHGGACDFRRGHPVGDSARRAAGGGFVCKSPAPCLESCLMTPNLSRNLMRRFTFLLTKLKMASFFDLASLSDGSRDKLMYALNARNLEYFFLGGNKIVVHGNSALINQIRFDLLSQDVNLPLERSRDLFKLDAILTRMSRLSEDILAVLVEFVLYRFRSTSMRKMIWFSF